MPVDIEYEDINFSPTWRENYKTITRARIWVYLQFVFIKAFWHPIKFLHNIISIFTRKFEMKADMTAYRFLVDFWDRYIRIVHTGGLDMEITEIDWIPPEKDQE